MSATSFRSQPSQRAAQKAATRERIVDGLVAQLASGADDFSVERLAQAVGVSPRTIYVHFPDRAALLGAVDERVNRELLYQPEYDSPDALVAQAALEFQDACANADLVRAQLKTPAGKALRARSRRTRAARVRGALEPVLAGLPPDEARRAVAVILLLRGIDAWKVLHEDLGLSAEEGSEAIKWALTTLIDDLRAKIEAGAP